MNEWGTPDWTDARAYGDTDAWSNSRWRWEFTRRREDYRADFDLYYAATVEHDRELRDLEGGDGRRLLGPNDPGFSCSVIPDKEYGIRLLNPRISEQPFWCLVFHDRTGRGGTARGSGASIFDHEVAVVQVPDGAAAVLIDLDRPIASQLAGARGNLESLQVGRHGKTLQWRQHPTKWFGYLRTIDGREAGATWREIFDVVLKETKSNNQNPEQEARGVWQRARDLMFNWRD